MQLRSTGAAVKYDEPALLKRRHGTTQKDAAGFLPSMTFCRTFTHKLLSKADIRIIELPFDDQNFRSADGGENAGGRSEAGKEKLNNGNRPWDVEIHDERVYRRAVLEGSLGMGEAYMDGWWNCQALDAMVARIAGGKAIDGIYSHPNAILQSWSGKIINLQKKANAFVVGERHYDLGNDLYRVMLDRRMVYSCAYWAGALNLDEAQQAKLDLICRKMQLKPGMRILDIGCGWGSLAKFAAENYHVHVTGITVSMEQVALAQEFCRGMPVEFRLQDYRDLRGADEQYDRIVSVGMFEHVGHKNYREFMDIVRRCLKDEGLFLLHTIGGNSSVSSIDPWVDKYIFPNAVIPSMRQIADAVEGLFVTEDWHNFGPDYDKTLMAWFDNFERGWPQLRPVYGESFYRMWKYYLLTCAGMFRARAKHVWQVVFSRRGIRGGYRAVR